ncbi:MAG: hypothetical protein GXO55_03740 [Chloroflexi bacterium]|nr:hypothetical protein [Chloroflexota bacterium]
MPYLIDGHNLIGTGLLPGISLSDEDDEAKLVRLLRRFQPRVKTHITVVFDRGLPGGFSSSLSGGGVEVIFAGATGQTADEVIKARIRRARHPEALRVVTNDGDVQNLARRRGCKVIRAHRFARELLRPLSASSAREDVRLSPEEVEEWLALFQKKKGGK